MSEGGEETRQMITTAGWKYASLHSPSRNYGGMTSRRYWSSALDLDPLVSRAGIGDGLHDAHVANAILEIGMRANAAF